MPNNATGTSMGGKMLHTKYSKPVPCDCMRCSYRTGKGGISYCRYYDIFTPNKKKCARFTGNIAPRKRR